jgi:hypothetical protein
MSHLYIFRRLLVKIPTNKECRRINMYNKTRQLRRQLAAAERKRLKDRQELNLLRKKLAQAHLKKGKAVVKKSKCNKRLPLDEAVRHHVLNVEEPPTQSVVPLEATVEDVEASKPVEPVQTFQPVEAVHAVEPVVEPPPPASPYRQQYM